MDTIQQLRSAGFVIANAVLLVGAFAGLSGSIGAAVAMTASAALLITATNRFLAPPRRCRALAGRRDGRRA